MASLTLAQLVLPTSHSSISHFSPTPLRLYHISVFYMQTSRVLQRTKNSLVVFVPMASSRTFQHSLFSALLAAALAAAMVSGFQFEVGDKMGWRRPTVKDPETYNEWAAKNRFHIGDTLVFKYQNDSVLVVNSADYLNCSTLNPISKFEDGNSVFEFDHPGYFFFISGKMGHCKLGLRMIVDVIHPSEGEAPEIAPSPAGGDGGESGGDSPESSPPAGDDGGESGGDSGGDSPESSPPELSSSSKLPAISCMVTSALAGLSYQLM